MNTTITMQYGGSSRITRAGQITLPKHVRNALGLERGEQVAFYYDQEENVAVIRVIEPPIELFERLAARAREQWTKRGITRDEIVDEVRKVRRSKR